MKVSGAIKVFVCFAPDDEKLYERLEVQLNAANKDRGTIKLCSNKALAGTDWRAQNDNDLNTAHVILLLVSPAFIDSEYCYSVQTKLAMDRQKRDEAIVIPIILRPVHWEQTPFGKLQALPHNALPVTKSRSRPAQDEIFLEVTQGIFAAVDKLRHATSSPKEGTYRRKKLGIPRPIVRLCPNCIVDFYPGDCDIVSAADPDIVVKLASREGLAKIWARMNPEPLIDAKWRRRCPYCGYLLPYNIESVENICVAIIGDTYAGKTCYIASLLHQMKERWVKNSSSLQMKTMTEEVEREYNHRLIIPLMKAGRNLAATQQLHGDVNRPPLIYELAFRASSQSQERRINLIFYDASGEDQAVQERMVQFSRYILRANAIIMLVDPVNIPEIYNRLPSHLQSKAATGRKAHHILNSTINVLEKYYGSGASAYFHSTPLAVMLSKSDLLKFTYGPIVPPLRHLANSPSHYLDLQDIKAVDAEVRALISETSESPILGIAPAFSKLSFFATSATGCASDRNGIFPFVEPSRCLDPLLWVLSQLKTIPTGHSL